MGFKYFKYDSGEVKPWYIKAKNEKNALNKVKISCNLIGLRLNPNRLSEITKEEYYKNTKSTAPFI